MSLIIMTAGISHSCSYISMELYTVVRGNNDDVEGSYTLPIPSRITKGSHCVSAMSLCSGDLIPVVLASLVSILFRVSRGRPLLPFPRCFPHSMACYVIL